MNIFLAGATGAIGRQLLPRLIDEGHTVTAITRSEHRAKHIFDRDALNDAVGAAEPEVLIHQLTSIPHRIDPRRVKEELAQTNKLRTEGTQILMDAARAAGVRRFVAQSISFNYTPGPPSLATEDEPLYTSAPAAFAALVRAVESLERTVLKTPGIEGVVLRYGYFYGPGTAYAVDGSITEDVVRRRFPLIGGASGVFSFIHVEDAAAATALALDRGTPGIYNIVDDDPAPVGEWLPLFAEMLGAPRPMRLPQFVGRLGAGRYGVYLMIEQRGASNLKAKQELGWHLKYASWRDGFRSEFVDRAQHSLV